MTEQSKSSAVDTQVSLETCQCTTSPTDVLQKIPPVPLHIDLYEDNMPFALVVFFQGEIERMLDGSWYHKKQKYRITYGNHLTGRSWEVCDEGVITFSAGDFPRLVIQPDARRKSAVILMLEHIVKIEKIPEDKTVYRHEFFHLPDEPDPVLPDEYSEGRKHRGIRLRRHATE